MLVGLHCISVQCIIILYNFRWTKLVIHVMIGLLVFNDTFNTDRLSWIMIIIVIIIIIRRLVTRRKHTQCLSIRPIITIKILVVLLCLVAWYSGRTLVFDRRTFPILRSTCSWWVTTYVGKPSAVDQPTRPTQAFILSG